MIRQIKCMCLLFALVVPPLTLTAQDSVSAHEMQYFDSLRRVLTNDYTTQLNRYKAAAEQEAADNRAAIDSLDQIIGELDRDLRELENTSRGLRSELNALQSVVEQNNEIIDGERQRFTRLLLIAGPSLLTLILLSTLLFFLLIRRQQESTDRKINSLKKYTYTEIEETRADLMQQFKKRMKKLREKLKGKGGMKKVKPEKVKAKKSGKEKSKKS